MQWRLVEGEVVVLDVDHAEFLAVNRSGAALWNLLADGATRDQLVGVLVDRYGVEGVRAAADVRRFLTSLTDRHLLEDDAPLQP
jgi:hypothetical protein